MNNLHCVHSINVNIECCSIDRRIMHNSDKLKLNYCNLCVRVGRFRGLDALQLAG